MTARTTAVDRRPVPVPVTGTEGFSAAEVEEVKVLLLVRYLATQPWDSAGVLDRVRQSRERIASAGHIAV